MLRLRVVLSTVFCLWSFAFTALFCSATDRILYSRISPPEAELFVSNHGRICGAGADSSGGRSITTRPGHPWAIGSFSLPERSGSADLFRVHPDGTGLERLTDNAAFDDQGAFSPDGGKIVFVSTRAAGFANLWILRRCNSQSLAPDYWIGWRLPSGLVTGREVDRLFRLR